MPKKIATIDSTNFQARFLTLKWSTSKAMDTYGYNRLVLADTLAGTRHVECGGGYCMTSAALADWANKHLAARLDAITPEMSKELRLYGFGAKGFARANGYVYEHGTIDGGIGVSSVENILEACGIVIEEVYDRSARNSKCLGFNVHEVAA